MVLTEGESIEIIQRAVWNDTVNVELSEGNIITTSPHKEDVVELSLEDLINLFEFIKKLCNNAPFRLLTDVRKAYMKIDSKVLHEIARHPEINNAKIAEAMVTNSLANRLLINFYLKISRPKVPAYMFGNIKSAREWLLKQQLRPEQII